MRLPRSEFTSRPWRARALVQDFRVEDVWRLPTPGGPDELDRLVRQFANGSEGHLTSRTSRLLFAVRWRLGRILGWDRPGSGVGGRVQSLRERLPQDLRDGERGPDLRTLPMASVFQTHEEWVAEMANATVHGVMHIGWVPDGNGGHHGVMTVLVKPNGRLGSLYMALIKPFRHLGVYRALVREIGREWEAGRAGEAGTGRR
ncbi:DUF2867 domain-containing protein [Streptomyces sp. P38-E01]|uniref:DUF2867 domain-containing protein n=1 Tax=Streptomyces tardus TaxID=2780544 RepID=A0A949JE23_9ACTN|nr:DUF2867 domain-containing protein [Streptomyces tardus]MBU7598226.1 DUF2867 domain-containing protein [Streptomyces tardus]